jgi:hypothetical protein
MSAIQARRNGTKLQPSPDLVFLRGSLDSLNSMRLSLQNDLSRNAVPADPTHRAHCRNEETPALPFAASGA